MAQVQRWRAGTAMWPTPTARSAGGGSVFWTATFGSVKDSEGRHAVTAAEVRLPSLDDDPCLPAAGDSECDADRLALWRGDPDAWAVQLRANGVAVTPENIV